MINGRSVKRPRGMNVHVQGYASQKNIHFIICMKRYIKLIQNKLIFKNYYEYPMANIDLQVRITQKSKLNIK